ncbi:unnamed protein product [Rotaria socialis]|uniref:Uncharacterized protein n=1 Tax=Rotaria socialis TaxID=392032 RepID=A0A821F0L0_9BILA|nr:unnamed protein product [Rotaria socialis]
MCYPQALAVAQVCPPLNSNATTQTTSTSTVLAEQNAPLLRWHQATVPLLVRARAPRQVRPQPRARAPRQVRPQPRARAPRQVRSQPRAQAQAPG